MGDPIIYTPKTAPGHMKHTFTGIRDEFPNQAIHFVIEQMLPMRRELFKRPEARTTARLEEPFVTWLQMGLSGFRELLIAITSEFNNPTNNPATAQGTGTGGATAGVFGQTMPPLSARTAALDAFVAKVNDPKVSLQELATVSGGVTTDNMFGPVDDRTPSLSFVYDGTHPNYPQPTPARIKNPFVRPFVIMLDRMIVQMTRSPSALHSTTINERDAAYWQSLIAEMYLVADRSGVTANPHIPTGWEREELDGFFNADGSLDPTLDSGTDATIRDAVVPAAK